MVQNWLCKHMLKLLPFYGFAKCSFIANDTVVRGSYTSDQTYANEQLVCRLIIRKLLPITIIHIERYETKGAFF